VVLEFKPSRCREDTKHASDDPLVHLPVTDGRSATRGREHLRNR